MQRWLLFNDWSKLSELLAQPSFTPPEFRDPYMDLRLVTFMLSIPSYPWHQGKQLLRRALKDELPIEVLNRPKTPLGAAHHSVLKQMAPAVIDDWREVPMLHRYVRRSAVPRIGSGTGTPWDTLANLTPVLLNSWLRVQGLGC
jgi:asparagine synthase (glutamine-hydrolysing)